MDTMYPGRVVIYGKVGKKYTLGFSTLVVNLLFLMVKNKTNHENTKYRKHEILIFSFSCFRDKESLSFQACPNW